MFKELGWTNSREIATQVQDQKEKVREVVCDVKALQAGAASRSNGYKASAEDIGKAVYKASAEDIVKANERSDGAMAPAAGASAAVPTDRDRAMAQLASGRLQALEAVLRGLEQVGCCSFYGWYVLGPN